MEICEFLNKKKKIQDYILNLIANENDSESYDITFSQLSKSINQIREDREELKIFLYLLSNISNNHHRTPKFFNTFEQILMKIKENIEEFFDSYEIFDIFKKNKRILLFLIENEIIMPNNRIAKKISSQKYKSANYHSYFFNEFTKFFDTKLNASIPSPNGYDNFEQKRKNGENENYLCEIIRNDSIDEFISFVQKQNIPFDINIQPSIFETNEFLLKKNPTLIEYSAFFGSIQIFKYLLMNGVQLCPTLWMYSVHGNNHEIFHFLEQNLTIYDDNFLRDCFVESIKCHHNDITNYFIDNIINNKFDNNKNVLISTAKCFNYNFFKVDDFTNKYMFYYLCKYDYLTIVNFILSRKSNEININSLIISMQFFFFIKFQINFFF